MLIHTPEGNVGEIPIAGAASVPVLAGVTVGLLDNRKPNAGLVLERVAERLATRAGTAVVRRDDKNAAIPCEDQVLQGIADEVQVVLTGTAD
ncbi:MAG: hypothetical protein AAGC53_22165 [Actinomycetota bacterium]